MNAFFIAPTALGVDVAAAAAGVADALKASGLKVARFAPVGPDAAASLPLDRVESRLVAGELDELLEEVISLFQRAADGADVVVVEGISHDQGLLVASALNIKLARNLRAKAILVADDAKAVDLAAQAFAAEQVAVAGYLAATGVATKVPSLGTLDAINAEALKAHALAETEALMPPPVFRLQLIEAARKAAKRIVLPEGDEPRTIKAAAICQDKGIARCVLLGERAQIERVAAEQGVTLPAGLEIIDPTTADLTPYVNAMVEMRKSKGLTPEDAAKQLEDTVVLGTVMLALDEVDGLVSGAVHTTANTIRPALQLIKTAPGSKLVSSVFFMLMPDQVLVYGDCAVNPNPTAEELADIAIQSADSALAFGIPARVAMISYSTGASGGGPDVEKVAQAARIAQEKRPDLAFDGPLQYDAASVESVGRQKAPNSKVAGKATVFVFPDLNTGNTTYKAVQRSAGVISVGPMLQGLRKPVNDLSRGALVDDIVYTIALTAIQAVQTQAN